MSQREDVLAALRAHPEGICVSTLPKELSYTARNRVSELRKSGVPIESEPCKAHKHRSSVSRYKLAPVGQLELIR